MKFLVISCVIIHFVTASPFLNGLLGGGGSSSSSSGSSSSGSNSPLPLGGPIKSSGGGIPGGKLIGDALGVKVALLTFLKNAVSPKEDQTQDFGSFENDGSIGESHSGGSSISSGSSISGESSISGGGLTNGGIGEISGGSSHTEISGSGNSGHNQGYNYQPPVTGHGVSGGLSSGQNQGYNYQPPVTGHGVSGGLSSGQNQGYNYQPPSTGQGVSGGLSSGGYSYQQSPAVSNPVSFSDSSSFVSSQQDTSGISEFSSGSATIEHNDVSNSVSSFDGFSSSGTSSDGFSSSSGTSSDGFSSSSSDGFSSSSGSSDDDADFDDFDKKSDSSSSGGGLGSLLQLPLSLIKTKVGLIQSLFGGAKSKETRRFYF